MLNEFDVIRDVTRRAHKRRDSLYVDGFTRDELLQSAADDSGVDFVVGAKLEDVDKKFAGFALDYYVERSAVSRAISHKRSFNLIPNEAFIKVDCIIQKSSEYRRLEFSRRLRKYKASPSGSLAKTT